MLKLTTTGNATLVAYDHKPILATDPWLGEEDHAYFGAWNLQYFIPESVKQDILNAEYIWFSHGHPDHFNPLSVKKFKANKILLPDHVGGRIKEGLIAKGYDVTVLPDRKWFRLSDRIRVFCITTEIQDSILLVEMGDRLFVNINDAWTKGCTLLLKSIIKNYKHSYLLRLLGADDADMINLYNSAGEFIGPNVNPDKSIGKELSHFAKKLGINNIIPFSSFHKIQRSDSAWVQKYAVSLEDYKKGLLPGMNFIEPFPTIDCLTGECSYQPLIPNNNPIKEPHEYGDDWNEKLSEEDVEKIRLYIRKKKRIVSFLSFINFKVGGVDNKVELEGREGRGITFETPRKSLMTAVEYEIFDDLLIGNFTKTTLHNLDSLYDGGFNFYLSKYGDNGFAQTEEEVKQYLKEYRRRSGIDFYYDLYIDFKVGLRQLLK